MVRKYLSGLRGSPRFPHRSGQRPTRLENLDDAKRVMDVLGKRLARYGLTLHPDKTHLVDFRFHRPEGVCHPDTDSATFNFLGFSHIWAKSKKVVNGVRQVTAKGRYARALAAVSDWCRHNRHRSLRDQHAHLSQMLRGHYAYYGISGNSRRIRWFACQVVVPASARVLHQAPDRPSDALVRAMARHLQGPAQVRAELR